MSGSVLGKGLGRASGKPVRPEGTGALEAVQRMGRHRHKAEAERLRIAMTLDFF